MTRAAIPPGSLRGLVVDGIVAAAVATLTLVTLPFVGSWQQHPGRPHLGVSVVGLVLLAAAATTLRRRWPVPAMLVAAAATSLYLVLGYPYGPVFGFLVLTVYMVARRAPLGGAAAWCVLALALLAVHLLTGASIGLAGLVPATAWVAVPFSVGAARRAVAGAAVREREAADQRLVDAERLRLSQEVHDVVGHGLAAIQLQADIALHVHQTQPEQAQEALRRISRASGAALDELRAVLAAVHPEGGGSTAPTPGLAQVDSLVDRVRLTGVEVTLQTTGTPSPLPAAADVAAYRVLQESLTNVVKHSPHPAARVSIEHLREAVQLTVTNQALAAGETVGMGISGMRRRVLAVGGVLHAGPDRDRGTYTVHARFPRAPKEDL